MALHRERLDEFSQRLASASTDSASRAALLQAIVDAATGCLGAMSAALFARQADGQLRAVATAGLFPPLRRGDEAALGKFSTRARLLEHVFRAEEPVGKESVVDRVVATGRGELIADASADARIPQHPDPALTLRSIIFVPLLLDGAPNGVLGFANPITNQPFTTEDFALAEFVAGLTATALGAVGPHSRPGR